MPFLKYNLQQDFIDNWLIAGPLCVPVSDVKESAVYDTILPQSPAENAVFNIRGEEHTWEYYRCRDDHFVDVTFTHEQPECRTVWLYTQLFADTTAVVTLNLTSLNMARVWLNGQEICKSTEAPAKVTLDAQLDIGENSLFVALETQTVGDCLFALALKIDAAAEVWVQLPTQIENISRREKFERIFAQAYLDRDVYTRSERVVVQWPPLDERSNTMAWMQHESGRIYAEVQKMLDAETHDIPLNKALNVLDGKYRARLSPFPNEYYEGMRFRRDIPFYISTGHYSTGLYGDDDKRRYEALEYAAQQDTGLFSEIAKLSLAQVAGVNFDVIVKTARQAKQEATARYRLLTGLLGVAYRAADGLALPEKVENTLRDCIIHFVYEPDLPLPESGHAKQHAVEILRHAALFLAGSLYEHWGKDAHQSREAGENMALTWLRRRARKGFHLRDLTCDFESNVIALTHLVAFSSSTTLREMAAVVLDKLLFTLAINSFQGINGVGIPDSPINGRFNPTTGISRLLWGIGTFNRHIDGLVSLAGYTAYQIPSLIQAIALHQPDAMLAQETHALNAADTSTRVTYKTPDYMLSALQDYRAGQLGTDEHIWQATLSPDAVIFVNHPACAKAETLRRPGFWHGNAKLPRVAQWQDTLLAIYDLPDDDWMGYTHAHFPLWAFDEHALQQGWAFARVGDGYIALAASGGMELITQGDGAYRELRSYKQQSIWLCMMGRAAQDGSFSEFCEKILTLDIEFNGLSVCCMTLRRELLALGWQGALTVNDVAQSLDSSTHYDNPYCQVDLNASEMDIRYQDYVMRLNFEIDD